MQYALGTNYFQQGLYEGALKHYIQATEIQPENPKFHHMVGRTYKNLARIVEAQVAFSQQEKLKKRPSKFIEKVTEDEFKLFAPTLNFFIDQKSLEISIH